MKRLPFQDSAYQLKTPSGTYARHRFSRTHSSFLELWRDEASPPVIVTYVTTLDHVCKFCVLCVRLAVLGNPGRRFHRFWSAVVQHPDHSQGLVGAVLSLVSGIHGYSKFTQKKRKIVTRGKTRWMQVGRNIRDQFHSCGPHIARKQTSCICAASESWRARITSYVNYAPLIRYANWFEFIFIRSSSSLQRAGICDACWNLWPNDEFNAVFGRLLPKSTGRGVKLTTINHSAQIGPVTRSSSDCRVWGNPLEKGQVQFNLQQVLSLNLEWSWSRNRRFKGSSDHFTDCKSNTINWRLTRKECSYKLSTFKKSKSK